MSRWLSWPAVSTWRQRLSLLVGVAVLAAVVAIVAVRASDGPGTATKADYQASVVTARDRIDTAYARVGTATSLEELADRLDEASSVVDKSATELDGVGIAAGFDELNARLVDKLGQFSDAMANTADQIRDPSFGDSLQGINSIGFTEWNDVNAILSEMKAKGLKVELLQRH
jgi:hypothetical protein